MITIEELMERLKNKGIYHTLGVFTKKSDAINNALNKLQIDKIL